jgi:MYXO-CTERM domain-containing protein
MVLLVLGPLASGPIGAHHEGQHEGQLLVEIEAIDGETAAFARARAIHVLDERDGPGPLRAVVDASGLAALRVAGLDVRVLEPDLAGAVAAERARIDAAAPARDFDEWFSDYKTFDEIHARVDALAAMDPDRVAVLQIGQSAQGRPIRAVRVGSGDRPAVVLTAVQHAREWIASMVPVCVLDHLVREADDPAVQAALERADLWIVPTVNPDGLVYTWEQDRFWRKNRNGPGIDLNRNWAEGFGDENGSSSDPDSDVYRGPMPFSESETAAVRDFLLGREVGALIDFHSFAGVVSSSWAYKDEEPSDIALLRAWGDGLAAQIVERHGYPYMSLHGMEANETIGYAAGTEPDWTHATVQVPAFTIELRPSFTEEDSGGFELPPEQIVPTCEEIVPAVLDLARWATGADAPAVAIVEPADGTVFENAPADTAIVIEVDHAGPLSTVEVEIDGQVLDWDDPIYPHRADIQFPQGTFELVAHVETWDGQIAASAPITIHVGTDGETGSTTSGDSGTDGGADTQGGDGEATDDGQGEGGGGTGGDGDPSGSDADPAGGCGCRVGANPSAAWLAAILLGGRRRRDGVRGRFRAGSVAHGDCP